VFATTRLGVLSVENGGHVPWFWRLTVLADLVTEWYFAEDFESELELLEVHQRVACPLTNERHGNSILNNGQQVFTLGEM